MTLAAVLIPFIGALLLFAAPANLGRALTLLTSVFTLLAAFALPQAGAYETPWLGSFGVYLSLSAAGAGGVLVLTAALVMLPTA